jgi:hypothetical protein
LTGAAAQESVNHADRKDHQGDNHKKEFADAIYELFFVLIPS